MADKAYPSKANRRYLRERGIAAVIPEKKDHRRTRIAKGRRGGRPSAFDTEAYKERNTIDGPSAGSSATAPSRPGSTSSPSAFDKLTVRYEATIQVAILLDRTANA